MDNDKKIMFIKIVCLIALLSGCLFLFSSCSKQPELIYNTNEKACKYTYQTYDEFIADDDINDLAIVHVIEKEDENVNEDEILIDIISNVDNAIVAINYGGSYDEQSVKMYSPVTNFKLTNGGIYYIAMNIDRGYGSDDTQSLNWVGTSKCFEKGKHYIVFYGDKTVIEERYGK